MLVLIDESGDPGFKITKGSTSHFVVSMVIFKDFKTAEKVSNEISQTRENLRVKSEFKFNKCSNTVRDSFFETICPFNFNVRALVVQKDLIYSDNLRENKDKFYNFFIQQLLKHDGNLLENAKIKIDGSGDREFKQELERYLKKQIHNKKIKSVKFADSKRDNLIQLADMTAGAIARSYYEEKRKHSGRWRDMLSKSGRIDNIWEFR